MFGCCKSCSQDLYGADGEDFSGMVSRLLVEEGYGLLAVCEECGPILVDTDGRRIQPQTCDA